jgi:hypothetical protein
MHKKSVFVMTAGFILVLILSACGTIPPAPLLEKGDDTATVYFIMGGSGVTFTGGGLTFGNEFSLWDSNTFLSNIGGKEFLVMYFKAGSYYFMAHGDNWYISKAELAAGRTYFYEVNTLPGFSRPNAMLTIMEPNDPEIDEVLKKCKELAPKGKVTESMVKEAGEKLAEAQGGSENIDVVTADKGRR